MEGRNKLAVYPLERDDLAATAGARLSALGVRLAVVETTAGGLISARLVSVPGASTWFERGVTAYSRASKLDVSPEVERILTAHGAVSRELVAALAGAMRTRSGVEYALAESGIAGPQDGRRSSKAAGTAVIGLATPSGTRIEEHAFAGSRAAIMVQVSDRALRLLVEALDE
ncbi:MAG: CinA family protein [Dehalococcoidia bacterium]